MRRDQITPLDLAFVCDDPCGQCHIELARAALRLIANRVDTAQCEQLTRELTELAMRYPRHHRFPACTDDDKTIVDGVPWHQQEDDHTTDPYCQKCTHPLSAHDGNGGRCLGVCESECFAKCSWFVR